MKLYAGTVVFISIWVIYLGLLDCWFAWEFCSLSPMLLIAVCSLHIFID